MAERIKQREALIVAAAKLNEDTDKLKEAEAKLEEDMDKLKEDTDKKNAQINWLKHQNHVLQKIETSKGVA